MNESTDIVRRYLDDAVAAEKSFETQLTGFAKEGDDEEVQEVFRIHANETRLQYERLTERLEQLGGSPSAAKSMLAHLFSLGPKAAQIGHVSAERVPQNLIMAFAVEHSEIAMYEALATVAAAAGDTVTENLARTIQAEEEQTAEKLWAFIPSRSKIAFNILTIGEVDPSVDTKDPADRIV